MCLVPKRCNDMMNLGRLQGFEVSELSGMLLSPPLLDSQSPGCGTPPFEIRCPASSAWPFWFTCLEDASFLGSLVTGQK
jgi:hypothetical protein